MKNITFITTGQPSTNPRLIKEVETLIDFGYNVKVIYCFYQSWAQGFDKAIINKNPGVYICIGGDPSASKITYYKTRIRQKIYTWLFKTVKAFQIPENAISRTHAEALSMAKSTKTDLYIAHNLGALPAAVLAAKFNNALVGYDAEDMHSGQFSSNNDTMYLHNKYMEQKYFSHTNYFTAASPLIAQHYKTTYNYLNPIVINNVFPKTNFVISQNYRQGNILKLFWFSQTVGAERGIEDIITAMADKKEVELHLLGNCSPTDEFAMRQLVKSKNLDENQIHFHPPVAPNALLKFAAQFDIGMATETGHTLNRDICLTNKIFTYLQCGLAIIASDTQAQNLFLKQYPDTGKVYGKNNAASLASRIEEYLTNPVLLYKTRQNNYLLGQTTLNWENESSQFLNIIEKTLKD